MDRTEPTSQRGSIDTHYVMFSFKGGGSPFPHHAICIITYLVPTRSHGYLFYTLGCHLILLYLLLGWVWCWLMESFWLVLGFLAFQASLPSPLRASLPPSTARRARIIWNIPCPKPRVSQFLQGALVPYSILLLAMVASPILL